MATATGRVKICEFPNPKKFWEANPQLQKGDTIELRFTSNWDAPQNFNDLRVQYPWVQTNELSSSLGLVCVGRFLSKLTSPTGQPQYGVRDVFLDPRFGQSFTDYKSIVMGKPYNIVVWRSSDAMGAEKKSEDGDDSKGQERGVAKTRKTFADAI